MILLIEVNVHRKVGDQQGGDTGRKAAWRKVMPEPPESSGLPKVPMTTR